MTPTITPFYAALGTFFYIFMAKQVINNRWKFKKGLGTVEGDLERTVRAHANFAEYAPLAFILLLSMELQGWRMEVIHGLCLVFLISRMMHFLGLAKSSGPSKFRFYGMVGTFGILALSSGCVMFAYFKSIWS